MSKTHSTPLSILFLYKPLNFQSCLQDVMSLLGAHAFVAVLDDHGNTTPALSAGAMPTNQLSLLLAFSAVPVLPATSTPLICAAVPVPCLTTPLRISRTRFAVSALMEVRSFSAAP